MAVKLRTAFINAMAAGDEDSVRRVGSQRRQTEDVSSTSLTVVADIYYVTWPRLSWGA